MSQIIIKIDALQDLPGQPSGTVVSGVRVSLVPTAGGQSLVDNVAQALAVGLSATFDVTTPGDYTATLQALDELGNAFGPVTTTNSVTIAAPTTVTVQVPAAASASLA